MNSKKKVGIALEGGGAKGAYQIGVLKALKELDIHYQCVVGTSIGALNGVSYVLGDYDKSTELWSKFDFSYSDNKKKKSKNSQDIFDKITRNIDKFESSFLKSTGVDPEPIIEFYKDVVREKAIRESKIEYGLATYCLTDRKPLKLFKEDIPEGMLHEFVFASCYLPVFTPRPIGGKYYLDGSMFLKLPVEMAADKGCDIIIAVRLRPEKYDYSVFDNVDIIDIAPDEYLSSTLEASSERIKWMIRQGYEDAKRIIDEKRQIF